MSAAFAGYVRRETTRAFAAGLGLFAAVVTFGQLLKLSDGNGALALAGRDLLAACGFGLPALLGLLLPISWLYACLLTVARLAQDREVLALEQAGQSPRCLLRVPVRGGLLLAVATAALVALAEPWGIGRLGALLAGAGQRALTHDLAAGTFHHFGQGWTFYAAGRHDGQLQGLLLARRGTGSGSDGDGELTLQARSARIVAGKDAKEVIFVLTDGSLLVGSPAHLVEFSRARYRLDIGQLLRAGRRTFTDQQGLTLGELWRRAYDPAEPGDVALLQVLLHRKLALPLAAPIFGALAVPLGLGSRGSARARSLLLSAFVVGGYYYLGRSLELAARHHRFAAAWAAWLPNLVGLFALAVAWRFRPGRRG